MARSTQAGHHARRELPDFQDGQRTLTARLVDSSGDIYGRRVQVTAGDRPRTMITSRSVEDLRTAMARDVERTRELLERPNRL